MSVNVGQRPHSGGKIVKQKDKSRAGSLKVLPPENGNYEREDTWESTSSGPSTGRKSSAGKRAPPVQKSDSYTPRRTPTPSKQVSLQAARRKESSDDASFEQFNWAEHERLESARLSSGAKPKQSSYSSQPKTRGHTGTKESTGQSPATSRHKYVCDRHRRTEETSDDLSDKSAELMLKQCYKKEDVSSLMEDMGFAETSTSSRGASASQKRAWSVQTTTEQGASGGARDVGKGRVNIEDSDEFDTDLENDEESSGESEEEEKPRAPDELKMEFLGAVMRRDWSDAQKLCQMILIYEPDHEEANSFKDLIAEKVQLEAELAEESGSDYETDDEEDDEDGDSSDGSDEDSDDDSSESDEDAEQQIQASGQSETNLDSGISSTTDLHERY